MGLSKQTGIDPDQTAPDCGDPDQTAPRGAVWSGSTLSAILSASFGCTIALLDALLHC